jgi:hypothetical protein
MRHMPLILGLLLIVAMTAREVYDFFVTNEGVRYFSAEPRRLLFVMLLGVVGGMIAFGISRLSSGSQRKLKLAVLGGFGAFLTSVIGLFAYQLTWAAPMATETGMWGWVLAALLGLTAVAGLIWLEFRHVWRQT